MTVEILSLIARPTSQRLLWLDAYPQRSYSGDLIVSRLGFSSDRGFCPRPVG